MALRRAELSVKAEGNEVERAHAILDRHQPLDPVKLGADDRKTGWDKFDPDADTYVSDHPDVRRIRQVS